MLFPRFLIMVASFALSQTAFARGYEIADYTNLVRLDDAQISPDSRQIVYQRRTIALADREQWISELWVVSSDGRDDRKIASGHSPRWSPTGDAIAFIGEDSSGDEQLFRVDPATKIQTQLTSTPSAGTALRLHDFSWSPDGERIAFRAIAPQAITSEHPDIPKPVTGAKRRPPPVLVTDLHYRQDGDGLLPGGKMQIYFVSAIGGKIEPAADSNFNKVAYEAGRVNILGQELSWSPDGGTVFFDGDKHPEYDRRALRSQIHAFDVHTGSVRSVVGDKDGANAFFYNPQVSPDGRKIAYVGYRWSEPHARRLNDIWIADVNSGAEQRLTAGTSSDVEIIGWTKDSKTILFQVDEGVRRLTRQVSLKGKIKDLLNAKEGHIFTATSIDGENVAGLVSTPALPPEVAFATVKDRAVKPLTRHNATNLAKVDSGQVVYTELTAADGIKVGAILRLPAGYKKGSSFPLIVRPHGGPHNVDQGDFDPESAHYAGAGYGVLRVNYRGSIGYGEEFVNHTFNRFPSKEGVNDILAATDWAVSRGADVEDVHLVGSSAGGMIGISVLGQSDRFKSAVILRPIVDTAIHDLITDEAAWSFAQFAAPTWEDPEHRRSTSPLSIAHRIKTPTLIMTGENDLRTPLVQSEMLFATMKRAGNTEVRLLRFPGVAHGPGSDFATWARYQLHTLSWIARYRKDIISGGTERDASQYIMENDNVTPRQR
jgi:dipeptidyl aminopeptidase/acylaminoacyl peptidase